MDVRVDSWARELTEDQAWALFYKSRRCDWQVAAKWAVQEYGLDKMPSRSSFYSWRKAMQESEHAHKIAQAIIAQQEAKSIAENYKITDDDLVKALMSAATSATMLNDNPKIAGDLIETAMSVRDRQQRRIELDLQAQKVKTKEDELKLMKRKLEIYEEKNKKTEEALTDEILTPEERERRIKEIFGL